MHSDLVNIKVIVLLFLLSLAAFLAHKIGVMDTSYSIIPKTEGINQAFITSDDVDAHFEKNSGTTLQCKLTKLHQYNFCGIAIKLKNEGIQHGIDLRKFNRLTLSIAYQAPLDTAKLKVTLRNYNDNYSTPDDYVSLKFNSITYNPNKHPAVVTLPFDALKVDSWWVDQYKIDFNNSQVELSNVVSFEILTDGIHTLGNYKIEIKNITLHGELISEENLLKLILVIWLIFIILLITLQRNKLKRLSMTDPLTGLYNRQGIETWTANKISSLSNQHRLHMFYLDLDNFKKINDTYGHQAGDYLLVAFAKKIQLNLTTNPHLTYAFARLSGDEFALVVVNLTNKQIKHFAEDLLKVLDIPILLEKHATYVHASLGVSELQKGNNTFEGLLARADSAMYYAKKDGKNRYRIFNKNISEAAFFRKQTAERIKNAIITDDFYLNFMPIVDAKSLKIVSVEVLLRTDAESLKGITPEVFIPIAEEYNLIKNIDLWVIETTFKRISKEQHFLTNRPLIFCINISASELHNPLFVEQFSALLTLYQINPQIIDLEITETSLIKTDKMSISTLKKIHALGVKLSLDDFGTGYTAFSQLINYPVDSLKIDKSFIDNLDSADKTQATMIKAIISIANSYQLKTIGEGIETEAQYKFLLDHGCDMIQGYLFAKPMRWDNLKKSIELESTILLLPKKIN